MQGNIAFSITVAHHKMAGSVTGHCVCCLCVGFLSELLSEGSILSALGTMLPAGFSWTAASVHFWTADVASLAAAVALVIALAGKDTTSGFLVVPFVLWGYI